MTATGDVTVVIPTRNRRECVSRLVGYALEWDGVAQVIVVMDRCTDGTGVALRELGATNLLVLDSPGAGPGAARNHGAAHADTEFVLFIDDDDHFPDDYASELRRCMVEFEADAVGAPVLGVLSATSAEASQIAKNRRQDCGPPGLASRSRFPCAPAVETPWLLGHVMFRRQTFLSLRYDTDYRGNFWREETELFVRATRAGHKCVLTSATYSWCSPPVPGGPTRSSPIVYEYWVARNNAKFLRRHGWWLWRSGYLWFPLLEFLRMEAARVRYRVVGTVRRRLADSSVI